MMNGTPRGAAAALLPFGCASPTLARISAGEQPIMHEPGSPFFLKNSATRET
jgi:hypothetical protein